MIPFLELKSQYQQIKQEVDNAIGSTLTSGQFILGEKVEQFEKTFAKYTGTKHCVAVGSGTDAVNLSLMALGLQPNDEVIMPSHTFIATAFAAINVNAKPVFVDIDENTFNISSAEIKKAITSKTSAVLTVNLYGQYCDMKSIMDTAENIPVVEDCSQSHGAEYNGSRKLFGELGCYSFYPTKNLGCYGDGGAIVTNNEELAAKLRLLRNYGQDKKYHHISKGYNSRLDELQAAILLVKLKHLDKWNDRRRKIAAMYDELLKDSHVVTPVEADYAKHVYYLYVIRSKKRDKLQDYLKNKGISTQIHYPIPIHKQKVFQQYNDQNLPVTEKIANEILSLPMFPELEESQISQICSAIKDFS